MKKSILLFTGLFLLVSINAYAEITSWEIKWNYYQFRSEGLMLLVGKVGTFRVKTFNRNNGALLDVVDQYVTAKIVSDGIVLNCYNPRSANGRSYSADNFKILNNGSMYTIDDNGVWSTQVGMRQITDTYELLRIKQKYNL